MLLNCRVLQCYFVTHPTAPVCNCYSTIQIALLIYTHHLEGRRRVTPQSDRLKSSSSKPELQRYVAVSPTECLINTATLPLTVSSRSGHSALEREYNIEKYSVKILLCYVRPIIAQ